MVLIEVSSCTIPGLTIAYTWPPKILAAGLCCAHVAHHKIFINDLSLNYKRQCCSLTNILVYIT